MTDDLFSIAANNPPPQKIKSDAGSNVPELSVSDLAHSLKQTLEDTYSRIRVRGELSGLKIPSSGHLYGDIKDADANINIICWRGILSKMTLKPEEGMDVLVTGKVSSYAKSSRYQIIVEKMELAGEGALLKLLEDRKKKLAEEGLFDADRKKPLPFIPQRIGVITSPTGAVIQDILHRLKDRFPRHVVVWPVKVQGDGAAEQIAKAIDGFQTLDKNKQPDLLIIARGGGSLEDLMPFNEEIVVRAISNSFIPIITAVGHETDTTLVDYVADLRAPTPTGAAEMAVPVRLNLLAQVQDNYKRLLHSSSRLTHDKKARLDTLSAQMGDPTAVLQAKAQTIDYFGDKLSAGLQSNLYEKRTLLQKLLSRWKNPLQDFQQQQQNLKFLHDKLLFGLQINITKKSSDLLYKSGQLRKPDQQFETIRKNLCLLEDRLGHSFQSGVKSKQEHLNATIRLLETLSYPSVLKRGYAIIQDLNGNIIRNSDEVGNTQEINIKLAIEDNLQAIVKKP